MTKVPRLAIVSTYPPRQCGLAVFSQHLFNSLRELGEAREVDGQRLQVVAMDPGQYHRDYPPEVRLQIRAHRWTDYREAAEFLNLSPVDVVSLQHEYGIFGGEDGNLVIHLLKGMKKPVVTTLHTVLEQPTPGQRVTLKTICALSTVVVVQARRAVDMLADVFDVPRGKIVMIPHGAPDVPFLDPAFYKKSIGAEGRRVLLTFGLMSPNKGIEYAIEAMARLADEFPDLLYIVLGATHPEVKKRHGESYRLSLELLVKERGLQDNVVFHNRFVSEEQLLEFLVSADIYLTPYLGKEQIVSGTLAYAVACGKAIVSTPYWYAEEILA
ncbi:MAG TPA: glycosyltransferase, partial [Firmicutes bacterium]|nr:glycosyltransferase [Bacillota bacterium]